MIGEGKVKVYRNLNVGRREGKKIYSVVDVGTGRVIAHVESISLEGAHFRVQRAGRLKVLATGRKNVHAYVIGFPVECEPFNPKGRAAYNPYKWETFVDEGGAPLTRAASVLING
jgi:hypothetical protein